MLYTSVEPIIEIRDVKDVLMEKLAGHEPNDSTKLSGNLHKSGQGGVTRTEHNGSLRL